ncbi:MAG: Mov34/MPN/PAD-1 family protein [Acidimicrobiales bacterium]
MLTLSPADRQTMVDHALADVPNEACGLFAGKPGADTVEIVYPCGNAAASPVVYTLDSLDYLHADRDAESQGLEIIGVYHSHTHTEAYPSATDVGQAPDPAWHYVLVSLRDEEPLVRSFRIVDGDITEEDLVLKGDRPA